MFFFGLEGVGFKAQGLEFRLLRCGWGRGRPGRYEGRRSTDHPLS